MARTSHLTVLLALATAPWVPTPILAQTARISEEARTLDTYPFSEPDPVPILTRDARLYPYHGFEGYSTASEPREWKVVHLENDFIEVFVLPEVGGKVWGAVVKETGHEFIYRNEVMKFRNISLRGPWTSGGIEFNFGVIGHTPATATPVDYLLRENEDGSVSCFVGGMDLPSRTHWRVEVRLPADAAYFETNVHWYNPTSLEQPYYNWMTAAAFAQDDLEMAIPGDAYLQHSGNVLDWPVDDDDRYLPLYRNNTFAGHKSYHVVGELNDFFGGYYLDEDYGFGHWARHEEMPGQKLWLWALSREGGVWEDLLTDTDGQYVEFQAGRLFVQYSPGEDVNPITQAGFDPMSASRWSETWFPLEGIGGLTDASRDGAMHVEREEGRLDVSVNAFRRVRDTLRVWADGAVVEAVPVDLIPLGRSHTTVNIGSARTFRVQLEGLDLDYESDPADRLLARPFATDPGAAASTPEVDQMVFQARELMKGRYYQQARVLFERARTVEPWHRETLLGLGELDYRSARYEEGLTSVNGALQLDAYDARANFLAGTLYRAMDRVADARDAFGWAARATAYRSASYAQLAELMIGQQDLDEALRYARLAIEFDRHSIPGWRAVAVVGRLTGNATLAAEARSELLEVDPLHHFAQAEVFLSIPDEASESAFIRSLGGEYPDQTMLELALHHVGLGQTRDALALLEMDTPLTRGPVHQAWRAYLRRDPSLLADPGDLSFRFPFRRESLPVLAWALEHDSHWSWTYLLALNLWAVDRAEEALTRMRALGDVPDHAPAYAARAVLALQVDGADGTSDFRRSVTLDPETRVLHVYLIRHLQEQGRWGESLLSLESSRERFPSDFNLALLEARALNHVGRALESTRILSDVHVLPSENARDSHRIYEQAHTLVALDALDNERSDQAADALAAALEWPEALGQGRPYEPEERMVQALLGHLNRRTGRDAAAQAAYQAVVDATPALRPGSDDEPVHLDSRLDLLALPALAALGRTSELESIARASPGAPEDDPQRLHAFAGQLARALATGVDAATTAAAVASGYPQLFSDLEGSMVLRALTIR